MNEKLIQDLQKDLDEDFGATKLKVALPKATTPPLTMVERLVSMGEMMKEMQKDLDALETEFDRRLNELRKRIGGRT